MGVLDFIQTEILGMAWLNRLVASLLTAIGLDINSPWGGSIHFFIYDVIEISPLNFHHLPRGVIGCY